MDFLRRVLRSSPAAHDSSQPSGPIEQGAGAHLREGVIYVETMSRTDTGLWIGGGGVSPVPADAQPEVLGDALLGALDRSRWGVPHPSRDELEQGVRPLLRAAGVRSYGQMTRGCRYMSVYRIGIRVTITPYRNLGPRGGFEPIDSESELLSSNDPATVGRAAGAAFARSPPFETRHGAGET